MPGPPAEFNERTVILIGGDSGRGKSTLAKFLSNGRHDLKYFSIDSMFSKSFIDGNFECGTSKIFSKYLEKFENPWEKVATITNQSDFNKEQFSLLIQRYLKKKLFRHSHTVAVILEGYSLARVSSQLLPYLKKYRVWTIHNC